jgi:hypothetical protein
VCVDVQGPEQDDEQNQDYNRPDDCLDELAGSVGIPYRVFTDDGAWPLLDDRGRSGANRLDRRSGLYALDSIGRLGGHNSLLFIRHSVAPLKQMHDAVEDDEQSDDDDD